MIRRYGLSSWYVWLMCLGLVLGVVSWTDQQAIVVTSGPRAWIDAPLSGVEVAVGTAVEVQSHAYARDGVAEIELSVNGQTYKRETPLQAGSQLVEIKQVWTPAQPGLYTLAVTAFTGAGQASSPAVIRIRVSGELTPTSTPTSTSTPTPAPRKPLVIATDTPTSTPTPTRTPTRTPTTTRSVPPRGKFWADKTSLAVKECTLLHWDVQNVTAVTLDGTAVAAQGSKQVCPPSPTTYRLRMSGPGGSSEQTVTLNVATPVPAAQARFWADKTSLAYNECTNLHWDVQNATAVTLDGQGVAAPGSRQVCPKQTTTYRLYVTAPGGNLDRTVTLQVAAPPQPAQVNFWADQTSLIQGQCTVLHWDVENATGVYLDGSGVTGHSTKQVCPKQTTTYSLHVTAPTGDVDRAVTIQVAGRPQPAQVNFWADSTSLVVGGCTVLHWDVENATAVYLDGNGVPGHSTKRVCPKSTTTYRLHVTAPTGDVDRNVVINVQVLIRGPVLK